MGDTVDKVFSHALLKVNGRFVDEGDPLIVKTKKGEQLPSDATVKLDIFTKHVRAIQSLCLKTPMQL